MASPTEHFASKQRAWKVGSKPFWVGIAMFALLVVYLAVMWKSANDQRIAVETLKAKGAFVDYDIQVEGNPHAWVPDWLFRRLGIDFFADVERVNAEYFDWKEPLTGEELSHLTSFSKLKSLVLSGQPLSDSVLVNVGQLRKLEHLWLSNTNTADSGMRHLKRLTELRELRLDGTPISDDGLKNLAGLTQLRELRLPANTTDEGLAHLSKLHRLEFLDMMACAEVSVEGVRQLHTCRNLDEIAIAAYYWSDDDLAVFEQFPKLKLLHFGTTYGITEAAVERLRAAMPDCEIDWTKKATGHVELTQAELTDGRIREMIGQSTITLKLKNVADDNLILLRSFPELLSVSFSECEVTNAGIMHLSSLANLAALNLCATAVDDRGVAHLAKLRKLIKLQLLGRQVGPHLVSLQSLNWLEIDEIGNDSLIHLRGLKDLRLLDLSGSPVGGENLRHLAELGELRVLDLSYTNVTNTDFKYLTGLVHLVRVNLQGTQVDAAAAQLLVAKLPNCRVSVDHENPAPFASGGFSFETSDLYGRSAKEE